MQDSCQYGERNKGAVLDCNKMLIYTRFCSIIKSINTSDDILTSILRLACSLAEPPVFMRNCAILGWSRCSSSPAAAQPEC